MRGIVRDGLPCRAIIAAEQQDHRRPDARMMGVHAYGQEFATSLGTAQLHSRRFPHFDRREWFVAVVERNGSDFLARPLDRFMQIVERLAVERNGDTSATTAAGSL